MYTQDLFYMVFFILLDHRHILLILMFQTLPVFGYTGTVCNETFLSCFNHSILSCGILCCFVWLMGQSWSPVSIKLLLLLTHVIGGSCQYKRYVFCYWLMWHGGAIWHHESVSTLLSKGLLLDGTSRCPEPMPTCREWVRYIFQWVFIQNSNILFQAASFENTVCTVAVIFMFGHRYVELAAIWYDAGMWYVGHLLNVKHKQPWCRAAPIWGLSY